MVIANSRALLDWRLLANAVAYYTTLGYAYVEVPWAVPPEILAVTMPSGCRPFVAPGLGGLVGSAEQSFIAMDLAGTLGRGRFVACTPCFRDDHEDALHQKCFMKVELYRNDVVDDVSVMEVLSEALGFFRGFFGMDARSVRTAEGWDIEAGGIELGSYGKRSHASLSWVYGTGVALPRLTQAQAQLKAIQP